VTSAGRFPFSRRVFLDSSGYLALINPHDDHHRETVIALQLLTQDGWHSFTTNFVIAETHALFLIRLSQRHATAFLHQFELASTTVVRVSTRDERRARDIVFRYTDKVFSLTDATSFAVMNRLHIPVALTLDRNFSQYGLGVLPELQSR
jgi:predicted nucleic acid-binding protein